MAVTTALLVSLSLGLLLVYFLTRPGWQKTGPSLVDAFVISVAMYAVGACIVVLTTTIAHAEVVMTMSLVTLTSALTGASMVSVILSPAFADMSFSRLLAASRMDGHEKSIVLGIAALSSIVSIVFIYLLFTSPIFSKFLTLENVIRYSTLSFARNAIASGSAGYMAPGYIKQFRDTLLPLALFAMTVIFPRPFRMWSFWGFLGLTIGAMLVNGQRSTILVLILGIGACLYYSNDNLSLAAKGRSRNIGWLAVVGLVLLAIWTSLTMALGRVDGRQSGILEIPATAVSALFDRAVVTTPRENALTNPVWGVVGPTHGNYWLVSFGSIVKSNAPQDAELSLLSNQLSVYTGGGALGNSPLGMPPDIWLTWGWIGLGFVPLLYAFFFGLLDVLLLSEKSAIFLAIKIYLFIVLPLCVSPYMFILSGGAICIALVAGIKSSRALWSWFPRKEVAAA